MFLRRFLWVPALLAGGGVLLSQPQDDVLRVTTRLVQIDVVVTDESGPVADLGPEDFTILDEGVPRPIAVFNLTRSRRSVEPAVELPLGAVSNRFDRDGRTPDTATVLLVDRLNTLGPDQPFADAQARAFLEDAPDEAWVAVYELTSGGLTVLGDYTSRPDEIRIALNDRKPQHSTPLQYSVCSLDDFQPDADLMPFYSGPTIDDAPRRIDAEPPPDPPDFCLSGPPDPFLRTAARYYVELRAGE
jgi:VWFA-related protein